MYYHLWVYVTFFLFFLFFFFFLRENNENISVLLSYEELIELGWREDVRLSSYYTISKRELVSN